LKFRPSKMDALVSMLYLLYYIILIFAFGKIVYSTSIYAYYGALFENIKFFRFIFYLPITVLSIAPIFLILYIKKQPLKSIGIKFSRPVFTFVVGILAAIPILIINLSGSIMEINLSIPELFWSLAYFFICIALTEELAFRGFIQTRIFGLIKNKWVGIAVVSIFFAAMHIPFQMQKTGLSFTAFIISDRNHLIATMVMHIYFYFLYSRDDNIWVPVIVHTLLNFSYEIFN